MVEMKEVNFKPNDGYILIEMNVVSMTTEGGIVKSEDMIAEEKASQNIFLRVAAVADDSNYKVGDRIFLSSGTHLTMPLDDKEYFITLEQHVLGKKINNE